MGIGKKAGHPVYEGRTRDKGIIALAELGELAVPKLTQVILTPQENHGSPGKCVEALAIIAVKGGAEAKRIILATLCNALTSSDSWVQTRAFEAMRSIGDQTCVPDLIDGLFQKDSHKRGCAADAILHVGKDAVAQLEKAASSLPDDKSAIVNDLIRRIEVRSVGRAKVEEGLRSGSIQFTSRLADNDVGAYLSKELPQIADSVRRETLGILCDLEQDGIIERCCSGGFCYKIILRK